MAATTVVTTRRLVDWAVPMTTRDGVTLRAAVHRMEERDTQPVALVRNPYGEPFTRNIPVVALLDAGFAVVIQDCRGCGDSDGDFVPFEHEEHDTLDAIDWCAAAPFSDGRVLTYGMSYSGMVQMAAAVNAPDVLVGMVPIVTPADYQTGVAYRGGAMQMGQLTGWYTMKTLQTLVHRAQRGHDVSAAMGALQRHAADMWSSIATSSLSRTPALSEVLPTWRRWLGEETRGAYWSELGYRDRRDQVTVPALHVGGWFDLFLGGTVDNFTTLRTAAATESARQGQRLIVGPWQHADQSGNVGEMSFGAAASATAVGLEATVAQFAKAAADGDPIPGPPVRIYVMGAGVWRDEQEWPLARTQWTPWYLQPDGRLTDAPSEVDDAASEYVHDPADPVPMRGGQSGVLMGGLDGGNDWTAGPRDQRPLDHRDDVLRFVSEPLEDDLEVTGPVKAVLHASTSAEDTDFVARLIDVWPDGRAMSVVDGIVRARFRQGQDEVRPVEPGAVHEYEIDLWATSQLFRAGHRVRLDVASSSYPNWDPNAGVLTNAGEVTAEDRRPATQHVLHDARHPSHVLLPVIPGR